MKNALYILNGVLLVAVGVLFYLHFAGNKSQSGTTIVRSSQKHDTAASGFRIAYFDLDSVFNSVDMVKQIKDELGKKEESNKIEFDKLQKQYADRYNYYQNRELSQIESEAASKELMQLGESIKNKQSELDQEFRDLYVRRQKDVKSKIEEFLKEYNQSRGYAFIFNNVPEMMFYKDSVYDITADVVKGLNQKYPPKKKK
jgi:outer membrane protein